jgi:acetamidase/formamidase
MDNTGNRIKRQEDVKIIPTIKYWNPLSGPIFVEGAKPSDTLTIYINDIKPLFNQGWGGEFPAGISTVGDATEGLYLVGETRPMTVYICPIENGVVKIPLKSGKQISVQSRPFIGTIAVATEIESITSSICGKFGGNMDCPDIGIGNKLFLPVYTEGAFLHVGDVHALQGDGELGGPPVEIASECTLTIDVIKGKTINWPRIESPECIMTVGNSCPLNNSLRIANTEMVYWLRDEYGFDLGDAMYLSSTVFRIRVNGAINPGFSSVSVMFPKEYLPES